MFSAHASIFYHFWSIVTISTQSHSFYALFHLLLRFLFTDPCSLECYFKSFLGIWKISYFSRMRMSFHIYPPPPRVFCNVLLPAPRLFLQLALLHVTDGRFFCALERHFESLKSFQRLCMYFRVCAPAPQHVFSDDFCTAQLHMRT